MLVYAAIDRVEEEVRAIAEAYFCIRPFERNARKASDIGNRDGMRTVRGDGEFW